MSTLKTHSGLLKNIAASINAAGYRNTADQIDVIVRDLLRWDAIMDAIYEETTKEAAEMERRLDGRRLAITTGEILHLRGPR